MRYTVFRSAPARKFLARLTDATQRARFKRVLDSLAANQRPSSCQALPDLTGAFRVSVGGFRILYQVEDTRRLMLVTDGGSRSQIYH